MKTNSNKKLKDIGALSREDFDAGPVSLDEIEPRLFLGNVTAATNKEILKTFQISHILTLDSVPLPQHILETSSLTTKFVHISDMPQEDILHHLDQCVDFISDALAMEKNVLVHCYFGVSRSSSVVIAYVMKQHNLNYEAACELVKSKRRFVQPNPGFISQLKLYYRMGCKIDPKNQKYKIYCLRLAGEQVRRAKILPQNFNNLIKPDPAIAQENPEPIVYRCRKCRRVVAARSHVLLHSRKSTTTEGNILKSNTKKSVTTTTMAHSPLLLDQKAGARNSSSLDSTLYASQSGEKCATAESTAEVECQSILFVEPIAWMKPVVNNMQGRLNCPKCEQKLGNFSWINGCKCPCGEQFSPAFYLIPSKVELSKAVQNVQTTV